ncbi:putative ribonuclease H-like domain-containing protein [Tanacetum coccineum]
MSQPANKQRVFNNGNGVAKPVWNNANRVNHANYFVPRPVQLNAVRPNSNFVRPNVNTGRENVNSVRPNVNIGRANVNSVRQNVNSVRSNVNTVRFKKLVPTSNSNSFSPVRPREIGALLLRPQQVIIGGTLDQTPIDHPLKNMEDRGIFDSGCSAHMTGNKDHLDDFEECKGGSVTFGGSKGYITGKGRIRVGNLEFDSVSFVKELGHFNLFSISQICDKQHKVLFTKTECLVVSPDFKMPDENQILLKVPRQHNMYSFDMKTPAPTKDYACLIAKATSDESKLWHRRLGHINFKNLNKLVKGNLVRGLPSKVFRNDHTCVACQKGKQHKASCKAKLERTITEPLHTLHMDLFGPTSVKSINHASYCLVITDDCTRFSWVFFLATKDETSGILQNFIRQIENQLNHRVKIIRSDNGTEFKNRDMLEFCGNKGIKQEYSNARTPQQNGVAERMNRTLIEAARTMLADSLLPTTFWAEAVSTACYIFNRLITKVDRLEKELKPRLKLDHGQYSNCRNPVKKVKKMEVVLKRRHVVLTDSEDEDAKNSSKQGRNLQEEGLDKMVRSIMKEKSEEFETPTQGKTLGEAGISPEGLEVAETLAKVLTQRTKTYTRKVKTGLRRKLDDDEVSTGERINTGFTDVNTAFEEINSVLEEKSQSKKIKKQIREEQASLPEIVRLQAQEEAENARKAELERHDALIAKRVQDELELFETQKNRMAQVQEAAKYYTEEDWDSIRAKLEANRDLSSKVLSIDFSSDDFAKKMVELINEKKTLYKEQRERDRRNRPMTQAEQREYMVKYLKNQSNNWKISQLKKLKPDELKEEFDKCVEKVEKFIPINSELEASKLKRTGINLQAKVFKKQKITDVTKDESVKREEKFKVQQPILRYNVRKSLAMKGLQKNKSESARSDTEEDAEAYLDERVDEPSSEEFQIGSIPQGSALAKIVKWQILKTGKKGAYQIIREDHTDIVYMNFQGLLNDLTRDDLKELYRLMILKYGDSRPEEEYERVLWGDLKTMFDPPSTEDAVWSITHQQKLANKLYGYKLTISVFVKSWLDHKIMACGKGCGKSIYMVDGLPKTGWYSTYQ